MLLTKITINDFGVYRGRNEFNFKTTPNKPIILCGGGNGAGKTTLFESIMTCLYGKESLERKTTQKQYDAIILRSIHRFLGTKKSADEASIIVEFQFAHEGKISEYQIMRMWQNNEGRVDEKFTIKKKVGDDNFKELDSIEESQWQTFINQLIPKGVAKLFFFDGEKIQNISEQGSEDIQIKSSFDVLLGLDLIEQLKTDLSLSVLRSEDGKTKEILAELDRLTKEKEQSDEKRKKLEEKKAEKDSEIQTALQKVKHCEDRVANAGGGFYEKRESLKKEKSELSIRLQIVEKEISELCTNVLPFSMIPNQLKEIKEKIATDKKIFQQSFEKDILKENFDVILKEMKSKNIASDVTKDLTMIFEKRLEKATSKIETTFNLSSEDMQKISSFISTIDKSIEEKLLGLTKEFGQITDLLQKVQVGLESVPRDDDVGPIISELQQENRELGRLESEFKNLEDLEMQEKSLVNILNSKISNIVKDKHQDKRRISGMENAKQVQKVLDEYAKRLRGKKLELLERYITEGLQMLLHKKQFIDKVSIDNESFEVKLFKGDDEISKEMLSKGELQMFATAVVWGLAKTSGRPLPFMIDTPLARLDEEHRESLVEKFYPYASHQLIIFSTNSEINGTFYPKLEPFVERSFVIKYNPDKGQTEKHDNYFFDSKGEKIIEV
ncbi:MAG: DNA sulfur modification protein DndD [Crenarchaeota archaeon]|nr:DNA sulfur modification protein DndD [Thermoproteota archaeon]